MIEGARLMWHPKLRPYLLVPLVVNLILFVVLTSLALTYYWSLVDSGNALIPSWLQPFLAPLEWFVWFIVAVVFLIGYAYSFNVITNIIAAPFYGFLSEATEKLVTGKELPWHFSDAGDDFGWVYSNRTNCRTVNWFSMERLVNVNPVR